MAPFKNRKQAGEILARRLKPYRNSRPLVLGVPWGGIPVAAEVARALGAPLDVVAVNQLYVPGQEGLVIGAVGEEGEPVFDQSVVIGLEARLGFKRNDFLSLAETRRLELHEHVAQIRKARALLDVKGRDVIVVDEAFVTGSSMEAAVKTLRIRGARKVIVAAPVGAQEAIKRLAEVADEAICLVEPVDFFSVGVWYREFPEIQDQLVASILRESMQAFASSQALPKVRIPLSGGELEAELHLPETPGAIVLISCGGDGSYKSSRNRHIAKCLLAEGVGVLLFDLLTSQEEAGKKNIFDLELLTNRMLEVVNWVEHRSPGRELFFMGDGIGSVVSLCVAAHQPKGLLGVICRGGRIDLAESELSKVKVPVLLIVGSVDHPVLAATVRMLDRLPFSRFEVVNGCGHLFEEPGVIGKVAELACDWIRDRMPLANVRKISKAQKEKELAGELKRLAHSVDQEDAFDAFIARLANRKVVMLGESTHGTQEFYELRSRISKILMEKYGFNFIAVEGDWPDCQQLNQYIREGKGENARAVATRFTRWPTWMWANEEIVKLVEWMRHQKLGGFYGLDIYSLFDSIEAVKKAAGSLGSDVEQRIVDRYSCFDSFAGDEIAYARSLLALPAGCRREAVENLLELLDMRLIEGMEQEQWFDAQQNARIVNNAEAYYRATLAGDVNSWNVRDHHMMETLDLLLRKVGNGGKAIVWAHNTHIGDYRFTDMIDEGYVNLGGLAREKYGRDDVALVGLTTYEGEVTAGGGWCSVEEVMPLPAARRESAERLLHEAAQSVGSDRLFLEFDEASRQGPLSRRIGHRAVGVVYSQAAEHSGRNYVPSVLPQRYDALLFLDRSSALSSLHRAAEAGLIPETWPAGW